jgi:DNA-binding HxlR family transcriptional regulator
MIEEQISRILEKVIHLDTIFGKWIVLLLVSIYFFDSVNFYKLNKNIKRMTPKVLSTKLKILEEIGLIGKEILIEKPLRVEYHVTKKGEKFIQNLIKTFNLDYLKQFKKIR